MSTLGGPTGGWEMDGVAVTFMLGVYLALMVAFGQLLFDEARPKPCWKLYVHDFIEVVVVALLIGSFVVLVAELPFSPKKLLMFEYLGFGFLTVVPLLGIKYFILGKKRRRSLN